MNTSPQTIQLRTWRVRSCPDEHLAEWERESSCSGNNCSPLPFPFRALDSPEVNYSLAFPAGLNIEIYSYENTGKNRWVWYRYSFVLFSTLSDDSNSDISGTGYRVVKYQRWIWSSSLCIFLHFYVFFNYFDGSIF